MRNSELPIAPHVLLFCFYNAVYLVPLLLVAAAGSGESTGGVTDATASTLVTICFIYVAGTVSFVLGTGFFRVWQSAGTSVAQPWRPVWFKLEFSEGLLIAGLSCIFVVSKIALIPEGIYQHYDGESMGGAVWGFSMFCSEAMILSSVLLLFSESRHNVRWFCIVALLNSANLLHGSRIFFIVTVLAAVLYAYIQGRLTLRRMVVYGPLMFGCVLILAYVVFLTRSNASLEGALSLANVLTPVIFESLLSQMSLVSLANSSDLWDPLGNVSKLFSDIVLISTPRALLPDKDSFQFFNEFAHLTPLGAFNGYAAGLIYFGYFFPVFYFVLGFIASWLYAKAQISQWWFVLYGYFTADFLFRIMRDGYLIPTKMLVNAIQILIAIMFLKILIRTALSHRHPKYVVRGRGS